MGDVRWMFHATAMGPDYDGIFEPLARLFGCRVLHRQQLPEPVGRDGGMTWIGDNSIEIGAPYGEGSSVATFVERLGGGMHSVAVQVPDVAATLARLGAARGGGRVAHQSDEIVFTRLGRHRRARARVGEPRAGRRPAVGRAGAAVRRGAGRERRAHGVRRRDRARSRRATASASPRCSTPTGRVRARRRAADVPHCALDLGDCMLALYPIPPDDSDEPRGVGRRRTSARVASRSG